MPALPALDPLTALRSLRALRSLTSAALPALPTLDPLTALGTLQTLLTAAALPALSSLGSLRPLRTVTLPALPSLWTGIGALESLGSRGGYDSQTLVTVGGIDVVAISIELDRVPDVSVNVGERIGSVADRVDGRRSSDDIAIKIDRNLSNLVAISSAYDEVCTLVSYRDVSARKGLPDVTCHDELSSIGRIVLARRVRSQSALPTLESLGSLISLSALGSNIALDTLGARGANISYGSLVPLNTLRTLDTSSLESLSALRALDSLNTRSSNISYGSLVALSALGALRSLLSRNSLESDTDKTLPALGALGALSTLRTLLSRNSLEPDTDKTLVSLRTLDSLRSGESLNP